MSQIIKAQSPVYGGYVIARDGGVIFIKGAVPDEVVEVSISEKKEITPSARLQMLLSPLLTG